MARQSEGVFFPPVSAATEDGLLMIGGYLHTDWILEAYRRGIFPWPVVDRGQEILAWFSPDPRAVIELDELYVSRRLARRIRSQRYRLTCDQQFAEVMTECAAPRLRQTDTWITPQMITAYCQLHQLGFAHSVEVWEDDALIGGLYGVSIGGFFAGESMFHKSRDASKIALVALVAHMKARGFTLFDVQQSTSHAMSMGAREIPRRQFLERIEQALMSPVSFGDQLDTSLISSLLKRQ